MASKARAQANLLGADGKIKATQFGNDTITSDMLAPNLELTGDYVKVPVGTTAERPVAPAVGHLRFNTSFGRLEQYVSDGWRAVDTPPTVTALSYSGGLLGADPAGGETVTITGTNFQSGANVTFGDTAAASVTVNSSTSITATTPAKTAGDHDVKVTNANGLSATLQNGISYNGLPAFTSPAAGKIGNDLAPNTAISTITIVAAEPDSGAISYSITSGALPGTLVLDSDGTIDGTTPDLSATTTYNFTVTATDDENQTSTRAFNLVVLRKIYAYSIPQSLMFNDDDSQYLQWTPTSASNRKTWTWSGWIKRTRISTAETTFFSAGIDNINFTALFFVNDKLYFQSYTGGTQVITNTDAVLRDPSAWYHFVIAVDTTQATASDRLKAYINGVQASGFDGSSISLNQDFWISYTYNHTLGARQVSSVDTFFDMYLTEVNFIDGQALAPTAFGESYNDVWVPKAYSGSYGTNGFHLPMTNDTSVEAFNVVTYRGNSQVRSITGIGFKPDLIWFKPTNVGYSHYIIDSVRGGNAGLLVESTATEVAGTYGKISSFDTDGFSVAVGTHVSVPWSGLNENTRNYVAWCWKAGDSNVTNTDGTITSTVRANQTYGFSIVSYTGNTTAGATFGHGLGAAPDFVIFKNRTVTNAWPVYHSAIGSSGHVRLNVTNADNGASVTNSTDPTSTVFTMTDWDAVNGSSMIAYCWTEKTGYSKFGSYTGTGSAGLSITGLGFKPALLIIKNISTTTNWIMYDDTRDVTNPITNTIYANLTNAEETNTTLTRIDFDSDGFTIQNTSSWAESNASGNTYIYAAFADTRDNAFWRDESGNGNDWQPVNTGAYRVTTDTPTE